MTTAPNTTITVPWPVRSVATPDHQLRPDILAAARDSDWERMGYEYMFRLIDLIGAVEASLWAAPLALDELRPEAACHRMFQKICDLEERNGDPMESGT